jgi:predicted ribosomally synthesized peptide with SipW-like signal peptide
MKRGLLTIIVVLALSSMTVGSTVASFSDTEESYDNYIEMGSLDLKVAKKSCCGCGCGCVLDFRDDLPWGDGLEPLFIIDNAQICHTYSANLVLWNAGCVDGTAYLHLILTEDTAGIADTTDVEVWYDSNNNGSVDSGETTTGKLDALHCQPFVLGPLPAWETRSLTLKVRPRDGSSCSFSLEFDAEFQLVQAGDNPAFSDTETTWGSLEHAGCGCGEGCSHGCWKNHLLDIGAWVPTGCSPAQTIASVFGEAGAYPDLNGDTIEDTLLDALNFDGGDDVEGAARILLRNAVVSLLNAAHPGVDYPIPTPGGVISAVNAALASGDRDTMIILEAVLDGYNNLGCIF